MFTLISRKRKAQLLADNLALAQENAILRRSLRLANTCIDSWKNEAMELRGEGGGEKKTNSTVEDLRQLSLFT